MPYEFWIDTPIEEKRIIKKTKKEAIASRKRYKKKGYGVSAIRRKLFRRK